MAPTSVDPDEHAFWPFLISRGRTVTYRVVVAPDFLCEARLTGVLWDLAGGEPTGPGQARCRVVSSARTGDFVIMFRVLLADSVAHTTLGTPGRDEHGRLIPVITGTVERGNTFVPETRAGVLDEGYNYCLPALRTFWNADRAVPPQPARAFHSARRAGAALAWEELPAYRVPYDDAGRGAPDHDSGERDTATEPEVGGAGGGPPSDRSPRHHRGRQIAAGLVAGAAAGWAAITRRNGK
ncbi:hypothetical protein [Streptomyces sp. NPDC006997]|uniref:hypothetical protein n=1 Tax=Streptomyces sp. NPDC006997 TaxID=3155356 RepID=UPI00340B1D2C